MSSTGPYRVRMPDGKDVYNVRMPDGKDVYNARMNDIPIDALPNFNHTTWEGAGFNQKPLGWFLGGATDASNFWQPWATDGFSLHLIQDTVNVFLRVSDQQNLVIGDRYQLDYELMQVNAGAGSFGLERVTLISGAGTQVSDDVALVGDTLGVYSVVVQADDTDSLLKRIGNGNDVVFKLLDVKRVYWSS